MSKFLLHILGQIAVITRFLKGNILPTIKLWKISVKYCCQRLEIKLKYIPLLTTGMTWLGIEPVVPTDLRADALPTAYRGQHIKQSKGLYNINIKHKL